MFTKNIKIFNKLHEFLVNRGCFNRSQREKNMFNLVSEYKPTGDQPKAIEYLSKGIEEGKKFQTLLGVTGSRKNFYNGKYNSKSTKTNTCFST